MHLIEIFLPISVNDPQSKIEAVRRELVEQFGGATLHINAPAEGLWQDDGPVERDRIVIAEVMAEILDTFWWRSYRERLEDVFDQDSILIRATETACL
ncbi:hypothetical protein GCM10010924_59470 [Rhizobium wenxiniae]|uniref:Uncharacterized protein n=1 Tax=Rhizobium wenxiniae TaxID=1737357 RepID=A0A7W9YCT7_9HYPH|nr:hypothetical protein [Rhizobium wenxiniae]MBB6166260.1 hypothetical protein [Rhizobium wenxiniae]GGG22095.1 hypothetical protein GCM10010924_59470 [Rhizobium wenxiniae]